MTSEILSERQRNIFSNLRQEEKEALRELRDNDKIIIYLLTKVGLSWLWTPPTILESALGNWTIQLIIGYFPLSLPIVSIKRLKKQQIQG